MSGKRHEIIRQFHGNTTFGVVPAGLQGKAY